MKPNKLILIFVVLVTLLSCSKKSTSISKLPEMLWFETYGGESLDFPFNTIEDNKNALITIGASKSSEQNKMSTIIIKTKPNGEEEWTKIINDHNFHGRSISFFNKNYFITGYVSDNEDSKKDLSLIKLDINGTELFNKSFSNAKSVSGIKMLKYDTDDLLILSQSKPLKAKNDGSIFLMKIDNNGNKLWEKELNDNSSLAGKDIIKTSGNEYLITGSIFSKSQKENVYLLKVDQEGKKIWSKTYLTDQEGIGKALLKGSNDCYFIVSELVTLDKQHSQIAVIKIDDKGNIIWQNTYDHLNSNSINSAMIINDDSLFIVGSTESKKTKLSDVMIAKINSSGKMEWSKSFGGIDYDNGFSVLQNNEGNLIISGNVFMSLTDSQIFLTEIKP